MNLPIRRSGDGDRTVREFERLRPDFATQLDRWPDFVRPLQQTLQEVVPLADVEETDDSFLIELEVPGVKREDVDLQVDQNRLVVTAERRQRERVGLLRHRTRTTGRFSFTLTLPQPVDREAVSAALDHGVLTVVVPKAEHARRRRIPISTRR